MSAMTFTFTFDRPLTSEELGAVSTLAAGNAPAPQTMRKAVINPPAAETAVTSVTPVSAPAAAAAAPVPSIPLQEVRDAMERAKRRVWGEGYANNDKLGERDKQPLVAAFRDICKRHGADKPSALPDGQPRADFIAECEELTLDKYGMPAQADMPDFQ